MTLTEILQNKDLRQQACKQSLFLFALYYFSEFFGYRSAPFHEQWAKDLMFTDTQTNFINLGFRESAKTTWAKIKIVHAICYDYKKFILWISFDQNKATANLFDVACMLHENKKIIADFGQLFKADKKKRNALESSSIAKGFITTNKIKVKPWGTGSTLRGEVYMQHRPDLLNFDDFENNETKRSSVKTKAVMEFIDETISGASPLANMIFNCNYIHDFGSVRYILDKAERSPKFWGISWVNAIENDEPTWKAKYVLTNEMLKHGYVSLEQKRIDLGDRVFNQEMMNSPDVKGDRLFTASIIDKRIEYVKANVICKEVEGWRIWDNYVEGHKYAIGIDIAQGVRADSSVIEVYDFTTDEQVQEYACNEINPTDLARLVVTKAMEFGECLICPENNPIGLETFREIERLNYNNMYVNVSVDKINNQSKNTYGWITNGKTKPLMLSGFRDNFEKKVVGINSLPLLYEMRGFGKLDLRQTNIYDTEMTNHFDRVIAMAITLMMRESTMMKKETADVAMADYYKQILNR